MKQCEEKLLKMKELIMVKVFVDKVDGDIVFTHYLEENDKNRKYTRVFNVRTGKIPKVLESEWM
mgnify:FL=1